MGIFIYVWVYLCVCVCTLSLSLSLFSLSLSYLFAHIKKGAQKKPATSSGQGFASQGQADVKEPATWLGETMPSPKELVEPGMCHMGPTLGPKVHI